MSIEFVSRFYVRCDACAALLRDPPANSSAPHRPTRYFNRPLSAFLVATQEGWLLDSPGGRILCPLCHIRLT